MSETPMEFPPESEGQRRAREAIEAWFRERGSTLEYHIVGAGELWDCVALIVPDDNEGGVLDAGGGRTRLKAAQAAQAVYSAKHVEMNAEPASFRITGAPAGLTVTGVGAIESGEAFGTPTVTRIEPESIVHERVVGEPTVEAIPPNVREPLEKIAGEFGWSISYVPEPDGSFRWFVFDHDRETLLRSGVADRWDDALLDTIEDLLPPSGEA